MKVFMVDPPLSTLPYDDALCDALAAKGCKVTIFARKLRPAESRNGRVGMNPVFYPLAERGRPHLPMTAFRYAKGLEHAVGMTRLLLEISRRRPDILHFQWTPFPLLDRPLLLAMRRLAPAVMTVHDTTPFNGSLNSLWQSLGTDALRRSFDHLIVHTEGGKARLLARGVPGERITVIPHGRLGFRARAPLARAAAPDGDGRRTILLFGRIKPYKGADILIEAAGLVPPPLRERMRIRIAGEACMRLDTLRARAGALGLGSSIAWDLRHIGEDEIGPLFASADILVFPYREIEASGVLMAGMAYGKPVIATRLGIFRELLTDGVHGRLVPPGDPAALAAALAELLADPGRAARMGARVAEAAAQVASWNEIAQRTTALYEQVRAAAM